MQNANYEVLTSSSFKHVAIKATFICITIYLYTMYLHMLYIIYMNISKYKINLECRTLKSSKTKKENLLKCKTLNNN